MKKHQKVAEVATILANAGYIKDATELLEGFTKEAAQDPHVKPVKQAFDALTRSLPKKLKQVSVGKVEWNLLQKEEFLHQTGTGGGAYMAAYFAKDSEGKGVARSPSGDPFVTINQWEPGDDEFSVHLGLNFEEGGNTDLFYDDQATASEVVQILKSKAVKVFQTWLKKNNFVLVSDEVQASPKQARVPGIKVLEAEIRSDDQPADDYDDEFSVPVEVTFEVTDPLLGKMFQKQNRVIDKFLSKLKSSEALSAIRRGRMGREILTAVKPYVVSELNDMAQNEFNRKVRLMDLDLSSEDDYWGANVDPQGRTITYTLQFDALGKWW